MAEYIKRTEALDITTRTCGDYAAAWWEIRKLPAADVAPMVHGRWMHEETEGGFHIWRCNRCGRGMNDNPEGIDLYCYHCGARMDGGDKDG